MATVRGPQSLARTATANMFLEVRMRTETEDEYDRIAMAFLKKRLTKNNLGWTPKNIRDALIACAGEYRPAYWRKLRLALSHEQHYAGFPESAAAIKVLKNPITASGDYSKVKPKERRIKSVSEADKENLMAYLEERGDRQTLAALYIVTVTGCRPAELAGVRVNRNDATVVIEGAKKSHEGKRGADRVIDLGGVTAAKVEQHLQVLRGVKFGPLQDRLRLACKTLWPRRTALPTFYSWRHQMGSELKASGMDRREVAYIMGHQATGSVDQYGDRRTARGGARLPRAAVGASLSAVRETHNEKTPNGYKPAKPVKARSVSIKNNKNKGMDLGGFDM